MLIDDTVKNVLADSGDKDTDEVYAQVIAALNIQNPLSSFKTSVLANPEEATVCAKRHSPNPVLQSKDRKEND